MNLLFDCTELSYFLEYSGYRAGVFFVALNLFRELRKYENIKITFVCNFKRYYFMKEVMNKVKEFEGIELLEEHSIINKFFGLLNYCVRNLPRKFVYGALSISRYYENMFYIKNRKNTEQIKNFSVYFSPFTPAIAEITDCDSIKRFMLLHDTIPIMENNEKIPNNPRLWCYRLYNSINKNDFYLANSVNTKKDVQKYFPFIKNENIRVTLLGADDSFRPKIKQEQTQKYVLSLCTIGKRKNIEFTIRNFFKFIEQNNIKDLKLVLAGGLWKNYENDLNKAIAGFDKSKIELTGYVNENLTELYSNALFFVFPSLYEGFGLPVLEAMKCGCPVITSNTSSLPEVIGNAGIQIDPTSDEEMIEAMTKMYKDEFFRQLCIERGLLRAQHFSWSKCASELLEFIKEKCV